MGLGRGRVGLQMVWVGWQMVWVWVGLQMMGLRLQMTSSMEGLLMEVVQHGLPRVFKLGLRRVGLQMMGLRLQMTSSMEGLPMGLVLPMGLALVGSAVEDSMTGWVR